MMYGLKPFNGAEMRAYLDVLNEAPPAQGVMRQSAGSPEREQQFINKSMADMETMANRKVRPDESVQEDELSELRRYFDMVEANETPTGAGQFSTKQMGDGTKVSFDPATGGKTVSGADGATSYNVAGQKTSSQTPSFKGFQKSTNYQTGEKTTTGQVGPVSISSTQRPDQSTVQTAEVPLGSDVTAKVARGIGFGGAGKDVQQGGNQVTGITTRTAQNPEGTTSSFVGKPTDQQFDQAVQEDDLEDKVMAQYNTPQAKAKSQAIDKAFASGDQKEFDRLGIQSPEQIERDLQTMLAGEKAQDAAVQRNPSLVMREWMALCR